MDLLTARSARVRDARALTVAKHRRARGQFLAEGPQAVREAVRGGQALELFVEQGTGERWPDELRDARLQGLPVHLADPAAIAALSSARTPQGIVAVCRWTPIALADLLVEPVAGQYAFAHEMADPGNAGALIRVADAAGARGVVLSDRSVDPTNPKCVRATAGSLFHLPVVAGGPTLDAIEAMHGAGLRILAADVTAGATDLFAAESDGLLDGAIAWVFGNEAHGLPDQVLAAVDHVVRIPILGQAESLNLATAAAVCLYAYARRQEHRGADQR